MQRATLSALALASAAITALPGCSSPSGCYYGQCDGYVYDPPDTTTTTPVGGQFDDRPLVTLDPAPPPISGGTLLVTKSGLAISSDPDRDMLWVVAPGQGFISSVHLPPKSEPWRLAEDAAGRVHVSLRRWGGVVAFDPQTHAFSPVRPACNAPRGIAYDEALDAIHVACARGELVTLRADDGSEIRRVWIDEDLRDVVVDGDRLLVSRFRTAEVLSLDAVGNVTGRARPTGDASHEAGVAWRMVPRPTGGAVLLHQEALIDTLPEGMAYYGTSLLSTVVSIVVPGDTMAPPVVLRAYGPLTAATLAVDIAIAPDGSRFALASPADQSVIEVDRNLITLGGPGVPAWNPCSMCQPVAVAFDANGQRLDQSREPARLAGFDLPAESRWDTGHEIFHTKPPTGSGSIACASCHPEGLDDGRVWRFSDGARRTQSVAGGVLDTMPLHWNGDIQSLGALMDVVFVKRMGGLAQDAAHLQALAHWLQSIPRPAKRQGLDANAVAHGKALFEDEAVGCSGCHTGPQLTNGTSVDVGTGRSFQVPRLVGVVARAPFLHDGCAPTLRDRFGPCGGGDLHGHTSHLTDAEIGDLVTYLESL